MFSPDDKVKGHWDWNKFLRRGTFPPFKPKQLIVDLTKVADLAKEAEKAHDEFQAGLIQSKGANGGEEGTLEQKLRGELECDEFGFMGTQLLKAERARRRLVMSRKQQLKRIAYKQGKKINSAEKSGKSIASNGNNNVAENDSTNKRAASKWTSCRG